MSVLPIVPVGHPILRQPTRSVSESELASLDVQHLIDDMVETMRNADGAGIAANQVGSNLRIAIAEVRDNSRYPYKPPIPLTIFVNPVVTPVDNELVEINEGCLSVPDLRGNLNRHVNIRVQYLDRNGNQRNEVKRGLTAGTFQHECDHLDGKLFIDRVADPTTFTTWDQFEQHHRAAFVTRITEFVDRIGS